MKQIKDFLSKTIANILPNRIKYWALINVFSYCSVNKFKHDIASNIRAMDILDNFAKEKNI